MALGKTMLGRRHVLPSVVSSLTELQVEGTFTCGTYLVTVHNPVSSEDGNLERALYGSFLPIPDQSVFKVAAAEEYEKEKQAGAVVVVKGDKGRIVCNDKRKRQRLRVVNKGDRPVQVGSHFHLVETNPQLAFDRVRALGYRLDIAAGTSVRFEPGDAKTVNVVQIAGKQVIKGGNGVATGWIFDKNVVDGLEGRLKKMGFAHVPEPAADSTLLTPFSMERESYVSMFGPTTGDKVRLGATNLWIQVEKDYTVYGDECTFGGGKTIRDGMGQCSGVADQDCLDVVVTNALIVDYTGIYKADIGIKNGIIVGIGKAGNPDVMAGVDKNMIIGSNTDVIAAEKDIVTYGGFDSHIHFICPQQAHESLASGITSMLGGGTGPRYACSKLITGVQRT